MATVVKEIPEDVANHFPLEVILWLNDHIRATINSTNDDVETAQAGVTTLETSKSDTSHSHALNGLSEKSYNSLTDKPEAATASDWPSVPSAASNVSSLSASAGADTIDMAALNTALSTLVTEINAINTVVNNIRTNLTTGKTNYDACIDNLQAAGLMA